MLLCLILLWNTGCALPYLAGGMFGGGKGPAQAQVKPRKAPTLVTGELHSAVREAARAEGLSIPSIGAWRAPEDPTRMRADGLLPGQIRMAGLSDGSGGGSAVNAEGRRNGNGPDADVNAIIPFEITPEIRAFAGRNTRTATSTYLQVTGLLSGIYAVANFEDQYEAGRTGTAAETLASGRGNCFAFTNLFVASARALGLPAFYMDASQTNSHLRYDSGRLIHSGHIVAGVMTSVGPMTIDFYKVRREQETFWYRHLNDREVTALFINNLGYEAMKHDVDAAPYFRTAADIAPHLEAPWNNLAVLLMASEREGEAEEILRAATAARVDSFAPYFNLGMLYMRGGNYQLAEDLFKQAYWRRRDNPFLFYNLGLSYLHQGKRDRARWAFKQALELDKTMVAARSKLDRILRD